jgi:hypothetical protein
VFRRQRRNSSRWTARQLVDPCDSTLACDGVRLVHLPRNGSDPLASGLADRARFRAAVIVAGPAGRGYDFSVTPNDAWLGLVDPETAELERPSAGADWPRHAGVTIEGDDLAFWWARVDKVEGGYRASVAAEPTEPGPGMLERFASLYEADDETILAYAQRWGALEVCAHGLPRAHPPTDGMPRTTYFCEERFGSEDRRPLGHVEPIRVWRYTARRFRAILDLAAALWDDPPSVGSPATWRILQKDQPSDLAAAHGVLAAQVNLHIQLGQVRPWASTTPPFIRIGGHDLFGALAVQLLLATSRSSGWAVCSACARPYAPTRRPPAGKLNYCPSCRETGAANRIAARNYRSRKRRSQPSMRPRELAGPTPGSSRG